MREGGEVCLVRLGLGVLGLSCSGVLGAAYALNSLLGLCVSGTLVLRVVVRPLLLHLFLVSRVFAVALGFLRIDRLLRSYG